jgi:hypothetical protein
VGPPLFAEIQVDAVALHRKCGRWARDPIGAKVLRALPNRQISPLEAGSTWLLNSARNGPRGRHHRPEQIPEGRSALLLPRSRAHRGAQGSRRTPRDARDHIAGAFARVNGRLKGTWTADEARHVHKIQMTPLPRWEPSSFKSLLSAALSTGLATKSWRRFD